jgi:SNF2 family DNA or RNA helicase
VDFAEGRWVIREAAGHVAVRLKRMFPYIKGGARPPFVFSDSADAAADLDWFMQRYPLDLTAAARARLDDGLAAWRDRRAAVEAFRASGWTPPARTGFREPEAPMPYQARAAEMARRFGRLLLLDDVGLGKTVSALAALAPGEALPAAVVVQPHLSAQWVRAYIQRFTHLRAVEITDRRVERRNALPEADVYVFRYSNLGAWSDAAESFGFRAVIFDEVQELRHGDGTEKGRGARVFADAVRAGGGLVMGLSATPIYNYGSEIFAVVDLIAPGALGTYWEFVANWCAPHGKHWIVADPQALGSYLEEEGVSLRRRSDSAEVAATLPELRKAVVEVEWSEEDAASDRALQRRLAERVVSGSFTDRGQAARELDLLVRRETGVAKAASAAAYARMLVEAGEPVLLAGWHRDVYARWERLLGDLRPAWFTGSESAAAKRESARRFAAGETDLLIMSLRSGAGLDGLQHRAAHVVYGELDWSPQVHVQFTGRLHRHGQTRPVTAHYLHVEGGSDPVLLGVLGLKASQSDGILNPYGDGPAATPEGDTRMRRLAEAVLAQSEAAT